jgi:hypothetical protein
MKSEFSLFMNFWAHFKTAIVKTPSKEIEKTQFSQRQHTRNQNSQFQNSQNSKCPHSKHPVSKSPVLLYLVLNMRTKKYYSLIAEQFFTATAAPNKRS